MKKKKKLFKKSLLIYSLLLLVFIIGFVTYVYFILVNYENNQTGNFLKSTINNLSDETLTGYLSDNKLDSNLLDSYKKMVISRFKWGITSIFFICIIYLF